MFREPIVCSCTRNIFVCSQLKSRAITEGSELKEQLNSVQEEAKKQLQEMATELHCKDSLLSDREREFSKLKCRLEGEVQELSQQLAHTKIEAENSEKVSFCSWTIRDLLLLIWLCYDIMC